MAADLSVQIPEWAVSAFRAIVDLPADQLLQLADVIAKARPAPDVEDLVNVASEATGVSSPVVESLIFLGVNACRIRHDANGSVTEAVSALLRGYQRTLDEKAAAELERLRSPLELVASPDGALDAMSKARELLSEYQCLLQKSLVLTDVRHVFDSTAEQVLGGVVSYTLALDYIEGPEMKQIHLALSRRGVERLSEQLQRALKKADAAARVLGLANLPELTPRKNFQQ